MKSIIDKKRDLVEHNKTLEYLRKELATAKIRLKSSTIDRQRKELQKSIDIYIDLIARKVEEVRKLKEEIEGIEGIEFQTEREITKDIFDTTDQNRKEWGVNMKKLTDLESALEQLGISHPDFMAILRATNLRTLPEYLKFINSTRLNHHEFYKMFKIHNQDLQNRISEFKRKSRENNEMGGGLKMR